MIKNKEILKIKMTGCGGLVVRASALQLGGHELKLCPGQSKGLKNGAFCLLAWSSSSSVRVFLSP